METKRCRKCRIEKPLSDFPESKDHPDGHRARCRKCLWKQTRAWRFKSPDSHLKATIRYREHNRNKLREDQKERRWKMKLEIVNAYGGRCSCCGEDEPKFLSIDHVDKGGTFHKRCIGTSRQYAWLKAHGFPQPGFRLLCFNCHLAITFWGECPHVTNTPISLRPVIVHSQLAPLCRDGKLGHE